MRGGQGSWVRGVKIRVRILELSSVSSQFSGSIISSRVVMVPIGWERNGGRVREEGGEDKRKEEERRRREEQEKWTDVDEDGKGMRIGERREKREERREERGKKERREE